MKTRLLVEGHKKQTNKQKTLKYLRITWPEGRSRHLAFYLLKILQLRGNLNLKFIYISQEIAILAPIWQMTLEGYSKLLSFLLKPFLHLSPFCLLWKCTCPLTKMNLIRGLKSVTSFPNADFNFAS